MTIKAGARGVASALLLVRLLAASVHGAQTPPDGPVTLAASHIDTVFADVERLSVVRWKAALDQAVALEAQKALQVELRAIAAEGAQYQQAVAAHDAACQGRDWALRAFQSCPGSKAALDARQKTNLARVADYQRNAASNKASLAALALQITGIEQRIDGFDRLLRRVEPFTTATQCGQADSLAHLTCLRDVWAHSSGVIRLQLDNIAYGYTYPDTVPVKSKFTRHTDSLLVGGTGWIYGYYVPRGQPQLKAEQTKRLKQELELAGIHDDRAFVNTADYDMIIGIAESHNQFLDLLQRVVLGQKTGELAGDQWTAGAYSTANQQLYASLKGTETTKLDCHSNGAMVCLDALTKGDVGATEVRLFGPQITPATVAQWEALLRKGTIKKLEIILTKGDPIGPASYRFADHVLIKAAVELANYVRKDGAVEKLDLFAPDAADRLKVNILQAAPKILVQVIDDPECRQKISDNYFACHDMAGYHRNTTRKH